jgi:hypothetical protein
MGSMEHVSPDGSWKVVVEAWSTGVIVYSAVGVTTRVYVRGLTSIWDRLRGVPIGWVPATADSVSASGTMSSSQAPTISAPIPGSPNNRHNDSVADCRAWAVAGGIKVNIDANFAPTGGPQPTTPDGTLFVDRVTGVGSATRNGQVLSAGPVHYP